MGYVQTCSNGAVQYAPAIQAGPMTVGATDIGSKLKGWGMAIGIIGVALVMMKLTGKKGKRKNPGRKRTRRARVKRTLKKGPKRYRATLTKAGRSKAAKRGWATRRRKARK